MIFVPDSELDVELCVSSGQVFRWKRTESGWAGVDGSAVIRAEKVEGGWCLGPEDAASRFFQLDVSLAKLSKKVLKIAPELEPYVRNHTGLRVLRQSRPDETLFTFLCTVNNHISRIAKMVQTLGSYGREVAPGHYEFPPIERVAEIPEQELRGKGFGYRARTITNAARQIMSHGPDWFEDLQAVPYGAARAQLCQINGIGLKVADCICLFGLHHQEAVPVDTHLWQASCRLYFPEWSGKSLTEAKYLAVGGLLREKFGELAGWAHQYLFYDRILSYRKGKVPVI